MESGLALSDFMITTFSLSLVDFSEHPIIIIEIDRKTKVDQPNTPEKLKHFLAMIFSPLTLRLMAVEPGSFLLDFAALAPNFDIGTNP
jgi:hypothetical protein